MGTTCEWIAARTALVQIFRSYFAPKPCAALATPFLPTTRSLGLLVDGLLKGAG